MASQYREQEARMNKSENVKRVKGVKTSTLGYVPVRQIEIETGFNCRDFTVPHNAANLVNITESIRNSGYDNGKPLIVRFEGEGDEPRVLLVDGETRFRALIALMDAKEIPEETRVPVIEDQSKSIEERIASLIKRNSGQVPSPLEQASVFERLMGSNLTQQEVAKLTNVSSSQVGKCLALLSLPKAVLDRLRAGDITAELALEAGKADTAVEAAAVVRSAVKAAKARGSKRPATKKDLTKAQGGETPKTTKLDPASTKKYSDRDVQVLTAALQTIAKSSTDQSSRTTAFSALQHVGLANAAKLKAAA
jgi:ParB/RepB/Spo0J family partition protein